MLKLTIGIPTFNGGENLIRAIISCSTIKLKPEEYETLVVDNHSDDGSIEKVEELKKEFRNIKIIKNETNIGRIPNWNKCVENAAGTYFIFLFSNDRLAGGNNIHEMLPLLDKKEDIGLIMSKYLIQTDKEQKIGRKFLRKSGEIDSNWFLSMFLNCGFLPCGLLQSMIYRTSALKPIKFDEHLDFVTDRAVTINYANKFKKIYLNKLPQFIFNTTAKRFHSDAKFLSKFKQKIEISKHLETKFDRNSYLIAQKMESNYVYYKKVINSKEREDLMINLKGVSIFNVFRLIINNIKLTIFLIKINLF
jgi:glycosyltransferase involved in cell wall biosynthesis